MAASYEFWITDAEGGRLLLVDNILSGRFPRVTNKVVSFQASLPYTFDPDFLKRDMLFQVWRAPEGQVMDLFRIYFIRKWQFRRVGTRLETILWGPDIGDLVARRIVANYAGTAESEKDNETTDDLMAEILNEQSINDASDPAPSFGTRDIPNLSIPVPDSLGTVAPFSFAWRNVGDILYDITKFSRDPNNGPEMFWSMEVRDINTVPITFQFRVTTNQPGSDLTDRVVFDENNGNLENPSLTFDSTAEVNYVYAGGQGIGTDREIQQVWDSDRIDASVFNRREAFAYASFASTGSATQSAGYERLTAGLPVRQFTAKAIDTEGARFGRDWNWGDRVRARFLGYEFDAIIRRVILSIDSNGREDIDAPLESEDVFT